MNLRPFALDSPTGSIIPTWFFKQVEEGFILARLARRKLRDSDPLVFRSLCPQGHSHGRIGEPGKSQRNGTSVPGGDQSTGKSTLVETAALLCLAKLLLTTDTGIMHLGFAVDCPLFVCS